MSSTQYYSERTNYYQTELEKIQKKENALSLGRLGSFAGTMVIFYVTLQINPVLAIVLLVIGLAFFGYILKTHLSTIRKRQHLTFLIEINKKELSCVNGKWLCFPDGKEFLDSNHPYSNDLDIFGKSSLFQFVNRTTSNPGSTLLADWLKAPASPEEIAWRQEAIAELKDRLDWRQEIMAVGYKYADAFSDPQPILDWIKEEPTFLNNKFLWISINLLSIASIISLVSWLIGFSAAFITIVVIVNVRLLRKYYRDVNKIHTNVSRTSELLKSFEETILLIEKQSFSSKRLVDLQKQFIHTEGKASDSLRALSNLVSKLDYRLNVFVSVPLNLFYFWDFRQILSLEKWKAQNRDYIAQWFETMAEFEVLSSFSNLHFNNPQWIMPVIHADHYKLNAEELGHPLISANRRIDNYFSVDRTGKMIIVTGSNMSGKSTFLRTVGVNLVLAMTGAPVCAKSFTTSHITVLTSMRIIDSLEENTSSFYAELKRLASIIQTVERNEKVFLLLDEILRGTNSNDRHIGSVALIKQLIKSNAVGIIATHDLALSQLEEELTEEIDNYNFDVKIENDELFFDYKLTKGVCKSLNASILMKKMGIKVT